MTQQQPAIPYNDAVQALKSHPLFANTELTPDEAAQLRLRTYGADTVLFRAGSPQTMVLALIQGAIVLHGRPSGGRRSYLAGILDAPSLLGDTEMLSTERWMFTGHSGAHATAVEIPNALFEKIISGNAETGLALFRSASIRAFRLRASLERLLTEPMTRQLTSLLWDLSHRGPEGLPVARLSQSKLARALGVDRKTVSRNLGRLKSEGVLRIDGRDATLLKDRRVRASGEATPRRGSGTWKISEYRRRAGDLDAGT